MTQLALFDELPTFHGFKHKHGARWKTGNWINRNWRGYLQSREVGAQDWCFQVYAFSGPEDGDGTAHVYKIDHDGDLYQSAEPIDGQGVITILGHRFGRSRWNH